jgi:hypothetical protein
MAQKHEWMFYELMWRAQAQEADYPLPWWVQMYFRHWLDSYDGGLFDSKEAAFASNANYRYWNMVGVKNHHQECLVGQAGEVEPVYDNYAVSFFLFDAADKRLYFPQRVSDGELRQQLSKGYRPFVETTWHSALGVTLEQRVLSVVLPNKKDIALNRLHLTRGTSLSASSEPYLGVAVLPWGPTGFQRRDRAGRNLWQRRLTRLHRITPTRLQINDIHAGPLFIQAPTAFGIYGNGDAWNDPEHYLRHGPFQALRAGGLQGLNGWELATDYIAGMCTGVFMFPLADASYKLDIILPVDDFASEDDIAAISATAPNVLDVLDMLETKSAAFWDTKLTTEGMQPALPAPVSHLVDLYRACRANLLILSDDGEIHPGPTIYDSFWIRDSSIEGVAAALAGDTNMARRQFGMKYPNKFNTGSGWIGPVREYGLFAGEHEKEAWEWDANGQALWAIGRFDRVVRDGFGAGMFYPYVLEGARWLRDNRDQYGLLHRGWSAEHIGGRDTPHYWDDMWAMAGLWEAARVAERYGHPETSEIWSIYDQLRHATQASMHWVLDQQRSRGFWEMFIPTGPADVGQLDSTMIGTVAYFHPCRLYMGTKLGSHIDWAARMTLDTIWSHFIDGGFEHESAWRAYGPYLTLQLAHCFLLLGEVQRMDQLLLWSVGNAGYARVSRAPTAPTQTWDVTQGAWNEQHCYPIAKDFADGSIRDWWYMGDIPHGWACAELILLLRDILCFEADEDGVDPHIYVAAGVMPHWMPVGSVCAVAHAPTVFGQPFSYELSHPSSGTVILEITEAPAGVSYLYPCRFGATVTSVEMLTGTETASVSGSTIRLSPGKQRVRISYT